MKTIKILIIGMVFLSTTISVAQKTWSNNRYTFNNDGGGNKMYLNIDDDSSNDIIFSVGSSINNMNFRVPKFNLTGKLKFGNTKRQMINLWDDSYGIGIQNATQYFRTNNHFAWYKGGVHSNLVFDPGSGGTAHMVLKNGDLGVGTTTPSEKLEVNGNIKTSGHLAIGDNGVFGYNYNGSNHIYSLGHESQDNVILKIGDETLTESEFSVFDGAFDDAIIGTFELDSPIQNAAFFSHSMMNEVSYAIAQDSNGDTYLNARNSAPINFLLGNALKMKLYANGNLGIGTGASHVPSEKLEVNGNVKVNSGIIGTFELDSPMQNAAFFSHSMMNEVSYAIAQDSNGDTYLNARNSAPINFLLGNALKMKLYANGNLGIGTGASHVPSEKLEVNGNVKVNAGIYFGTSSIHQDEGGAIELGGNGKTPYIDFKNDNALDYSSRIILNGEGNLQVMGGIVETTGLNLTGDGASTNTIDSNINGTIVFGGEDGSTLTNEDIADSYYPDFSLWVEEGINTEDIVIATTNQWAETYPDYVFEAGYKLPELKDVEAYIKENGHLEDIPSKAEVEEKGWSLPNMDQKLLKKVEELTLYTIEQQYEIKHLKQQLSQLETLEVEIKLIKQAIQNGNHK